MIIINLQTEYLTEPLAIDTLSPRLSWQLEAGSEVRQRAYQIYVATTAKLLEEDYADMWNSGIIESSRHNQIPYNGKKLQSAATYYWKVKVWFAGSEETVCSQISSWTMGLLVQEDWQAKWITAAGASENLHEGQEERPAYAAPYLRKAFTTIRPVKKAIVFVSGLGYYELFMNGIKIGDHVLDPGVTNYEKTVLYTAYDVTEAFVENSHTAATQTHVIGMLLGRGRFSQLTKDVWRWEQSPWHDEPVGIVQLHLAYADGTTQLIGSDESWKTADSPLQSDCLLAGEIYDAREEIANLWQAGFDDSLWKQARIAREPRGRLSAQMLPPIKVMNTFTPSAITKLGAGHYLVDFGQMLTGWTALQVQGSAGTAVELCYGEELDGSGRIHVEHPDIEGVLQRDKYILRGEGVEKWEARFSYKGFRFVEVKGYPGELKSEALTAKHVYSSVAHTGSFTCSNERLNAIHHNSIMSIVNNLHSIPTDTPVYEKNGWTADAMLSAEAAIYNYDMAAFYTKWMRDIEESITEQGELAPIVPTSGWGYEESTFGWDLVKGPVPAWDAAFFEICWYCYESYGDVRMMETHFAAMKRYLLYMETHLEQGIMKKGLGDWFAPAGEACPSIGNSPEGASLVSTAYCFKMTDTFVKMAELLNRKEEQTYFADLRAKLSTAFHANFYNPHAQVYETEIAAGYRQTSNILPLAFGLVPNTEKAAVLQNLVDHIQNQCNGHLDTGIIGTKFILHVLSDNGHHELAYEIANQSTYPSWGYWIEQSATSHWETWEKQGRSRNHHMFGSIDDWFYRKLAGISMLKPGYRKVQIKPYVPRLLEAAAAAIRIPAGKLHASWKQGNSRFKLTVQIPSHTLAIIFVPKLFGQVVESSARANYVKDEDGYAVFEAGPGVYNFVSTGD
ncbi:family 78 glycoside hydrolase catalytic domain [Paenibacillus sp. IITD108]|uniref:family 78 glycoside hydrolase catalytic domain n=1 Tax=Paenibacillus sp. IITD108 TaxID=3116649 RepID=UPI002F3F41ED